MGSQLGAISSEQNPRERLALLKRYIRDGEQRLADARQARIEAVVELRKKGVAWRELMGLTGCSEQYLRKVTTGR